jgi:xanthine dehydrogenase YagR molybdenum-binding subunit
MKFNEPAGTNPIDQLKVVGHPLDRIDGPLKVSGRAPYAYERHDVVPDQAYAFVRGAGFAKGVIDDIRTEETLTAPGVIAVLTTLDMDPLPTTAHNATKLFGGAEVAHYHQAIAVVVAETFEQARAAAALLDVKYSLEDGRFDIEAEAENAKIVRDVVNLGFFAPRVSKRGDFDSAFAEAEVTIDQHYSTAPEYHGQMEPHATIAAWDGDELTVWTSTQWVATCHQDLAKMLSMSAKRVRVESPFVGGGFGSKLYVRSDAVLAALGAKVAGRPVKLALPRPFIFNNGTHRSATLQHVQLGADRDGRLTAIRHVSICGNFKGGNPEPAVAQSRLLYAAENREIYMKLAQLDLPEANDMRAPGEAPGLMVLEMAMDELAEKLGIDPVELRVINDTQVDPHDPSRPFSERHLVECLQSGATRFGWSKRSHVPGQVRDGEWLVGMGVAAGIRNSQVMPSGARVRLQPDGRLIVETDMTDIGTGSYTIIAQTAAEMMGIEVSEVEVVLGSSDFPQSAGSGGQWGANNATSGVYAACDKLRTSVLRKLGLNGPDAKFTEGRVVSGNQSFDLRDAAADEELVAEGEIKYGHLDKKYQQSTFAAHFAEVGVNAFTGEVRIRRMLAVCDAGRILNPKTARSQVLGGMIMGVGGALVEELAVDKIRGFFVNHDFAGYEVPVHADIPELDVVLLDYPDDKSSPMKAKGIGELGLCGVGAAVANAVYNATGVRVRDYPVTLDKHLSGLPAIV